MKKLLKNKKAIILIIVIALVIVAGVLKNMSKTPVSATVYKVDKGSVFKLVEERGTVIGEDERKIYSNISGTIDEITVKEGDIIESNHVLAKINSKDLELDLLSNEAKLKGLQAKYNEALKPLDEEEILRSEATVNTMKIQYEKAKTKFENSQVLYENGGISKEELNEIEIAMNISYDNLIIAENNLALLKKGLSEDEKKVYESQIAEINYSLDKLNNEINKHSIKAPFKGVVTNVFVKEGTVVTAGNELLELVNTDNIYIEVEILAEDIHKVAVGEDVLIEDEDLNISLKGKLSKIYPKAYSKLSDLGIEQKRVKVEVELLEHSDLLGLGFDIDVKIISEKSDDALRVPKDSVFTINDSHYVFIVQNSKAYLKEIKIGLEGEDYVEVLSNLDEGDTVIISPSDEISDGGAVKIITDK